MRKNTVDQKIGKGAAKVLTEIVKYHDEHGYMPTVRELCKLTGRSSTNTIYAHMRNLFLKGYIETDTDTIGAPRAFRLGQRSYDEGYAA